MLFIVSGRDHANGIEARLRFRPQHRAYYEGLGDDLILSGPYLDAQGEPIGSMIIIRAANQPAADAFAHADPYWTAGVFETLTVSRWDWFMKRPEGLVT
jgi:uncharacterized protein